MLITNVKVLITTISMCFALIGNTQESNFSILPKNQELEIDKLCESWNSETSPGIAVVILDDGKLVYQKGFGMANIEEQKAVKSNTKLLQGDDLLILSFDINNEKEFYQRSPIDPQEWLFKSYQPVSIQEKNLSKYAGTYFNREFSTLYDKSIEENKLVLRYNHSDEVGLTPIYGMTFSCNNNYFSNLEFTQDQNHAVKGLMIKHDGEDSIFFNKILLP